jgi:ribonuclease-3
MVSKEKKIFHYDIYEDNGIDGTRFFGVKLSIDGKVIAKARATSKKESRRKASQRTYFALQEKWTKNNIIFTSKLHRFRS